MAGRKPFNGPDDERARRVRRAVFEFLSRRRAGEDLTEESFVADKGDLMPELADGIAAALRIHRSVLDVDRSLGADAQEQPPVGGLPRIKGYRIRRELGRGGQGAVFEAVHEPTGRVVAVKVLTGLSKGAAARFDREARTLALLSHPGLVSILDRGMTADGAYFLAVDYVEGEDLDEWLAKEPGPREVAALFAKVAAAVGAAHARGVVHRDLKPSNIRIDSLGNPRVIDFGLAMLVEPDLMDRRVTMTRDVVGSLAWMSPEQATGDKRATRPASDVYTLGVMLYHALVGRFPYAVDGPVMKAIHEIVNTPASFRANGPRVEPSLAGVVLRCLNKLPANRYPSAAELAGDLEAFVAGNLKPTIRPSRRRWPALAIAVAVVASCVTGWAVFERGPDDVVPDPVALPVIRNSIGTEFVEVPAGSFKMGSPSVEPGRNDDEQPHPVTISRPFWIGRTEVTRAEYRRVIGSLPAGVSESPPNAPVDRVSWADSCAFCQALSSLDGREYRLPTEAEWEYACRAGSLSAFAVPSGQLGQIAWYASNSGGNTRAVRTRRPNRWGLFDLHGNVAEWTADHYVPHLGTGPRVDPSFEVGGESYVVRGGTATDDPQQCRSAARVSAHGESRKPGVGFRVVLVPKAVRSQ